MYVPGLTCLPGHVTYSMKGTSTLLDQGKGDDGGRWSLEWESYTLLLPHTAAVSCLYMKTKDIYKVQKDLGHSSMTVTLTYMHSLGLINNIDAEDASEL